MPNFACEPRTWTRSCPLLPGSSAGLGDSSSKETRVVAAFCNGDDGDSEMVAGPGDAFGPGRMTRHSGDAASTKAGSPLILTKLASVENPAPHIENRSCKDTTCAIEIGADELAG